MNHHIERKEPMQVTKVETAGDIPEPEENGYDDDQLMRDLNYYRAEALAKKLLEKGLVTGVQYARIMAENRRTFRPFLAEIL